MTARPGTPPPPARDATESYLAEIAARLAGPARGRASIIAELRAGLADAADTYRTAGLPASEAARAAVREFGDPALVAAAFGPGLAAQRARRVALGLLTTGPFTGLLWASAARASHLGIHRAPPWQWAGLPPGTRAVIPLAATLAVTAVGAALFTIAVTGRLTRWLPAGLRRAPAAAALAGTGAAAADATILALLASQLAVDPGTLSPAPVAAATAASLARLTLARQAARRCLASRAQAAIAGRSDGAGRG